MAPWADATLGVLCLANVVLMAYGMFGVDGAIKQPLGAWFGWHPFLMTLSFACLMNLGRWAYIYEGSTGSVPLEKDARRNIHRAINGSAVIVLLAGYVAIFAAHLPKGLFFGYDFQTKAWTDPGWSKVLHIFLGYFVILLSIAQGFMGAYKMKFLKKGERIFTFHGTLGKVIMALGTLNILVAVYFWGWSKALKIVLTMLLTAASATAILFSPPHTNETSRLTGETSLQGGRPGAE